MFKEDYKKLYDEVHPSSELVEQTKKKALKEYQSKTLESEDEIWMEEDYGTEKVEYTEEKRKIIPLAEGKGRRILQIAGGLAAGIAIITVGYLFSRTLQKQESFVGTVSENTTEPTSISSPSIAPSGEEQTEKKKEEKKKASKKKGSSQEENTSSTVDTPVTTLAKMGNADGVRLDYVSNNLVIFHGNFGILGYNLSSRKLVVCIPAKKYQFPDMWIGEQVIVNQEGTKIAWYGMASSSLELNVYDIATGTYSQKDSMEWLAENPTFSGVASVTGTNADVYSSKATDMCVKLSESRTCQLFYQAPSLSLQASLGIAIVDTDAKTEQIYDVFGNEGRQVAKSYGASYGGYHNEYGKKIFESDTKETNTVAETKEPDVQPTENVVVTETPVEPTQEPEPEPTENVTKPDVTENPQKLTESME